MAGWLVGYCRPRHGKWHTGCDFSRRFADVPLANTVTMMTISEIEMDMALVIAVRAGTKHRRKPMTRAFPQSIAKILSDRHIGQRQHTAIGQRERAHIDGVAFAMFAQLGAGHAVAAATFKVVEGLNGTKLCSELVGQRRRFIPQPAGDRLRKRTIQQRRRLELDAPALGAQHRIDPHHVLAATGLRTDQTGHWLDDGDRLETLIAIGWRGADLG